MPNKMQIQASAKKKCKLKSKKIGCHYSPFSEAVISVSAEVLLYAKICQPNDAMGDSTLFTYNRDHNLRSAVCFIYHMPCYDLLLAGHQEL